MDTRAIRWNTLWRPLLYESLGWFLGAFLILAGSFYFVAESWAGLPTLARALVVFAFTAGYSVGFALWGGFLARRPALSGAGRVLALIGSAIAPLAGIPLSLAGAEHAAWTWGACGAWALVAAWLAGRAAVAVDRPSRRAVQVSMGLSTLVMGLGPAVATLGTGALWLDALPVLWVGWAVRAGPPRSSARAMAFAVLAPAYLGALFVARMHLALAAAGSLPPLPTYAPFAAAVLYLALQVRRKYGERNADALDVVAVALQLALAVASVGGNAPAFFATWALTAVTTLSLARGAPSRVRWLYVSYGALYFSYQSIGQLVPGFLKELLAQVRHALGYAATAPLPFNFDAVYAVPFVLGGLVLAWRMMRAPAPAHLRHRRDRVAEVLVRCTAVASGAVGLLSVCGLDQRAALWSVPALIALCLTGGARLRRPWLTHAGFGLTLLLPLFTTALWGTTVGALTAGLAGVSLAVFGRRALPFAAFQGLLACVLAWSGPLGLLSAGAILLGGSALVMAARPLERSWLTSVALLFPATAVPWAVSFAAPSCAPLATALLGAAATAVWLRGPGRKSLLLTALAAAAVAAVWQCVAPATGASPTLFSLTLGVAAGTFWCGARREPGLGSAAALLLCSALVPAALGLPTGGTLFSPETSAVLFTALSASASLRAAFGRATVFTTTVAALSAIGAIAAAVSGGGGPALLGLAALAVLVSTRALHASVTLPVAAAFAVAAFVPEGVVGTLALALLLSVAGLLPRWPAAWRLLAGERRMAVAASASGLGALLVACVEAAFWRHSGGAGLTWVGLAVTLALPMVWIRATRWQGLSLLIAPLATAWLLARGESGAVFLIPLVVLALTRWASQVTPPRRELGSVFQTCAVFGLLPAAGALALPSGVPPWLGVAAFVLGLGSSSARLPSLRLVCAAALAAFVPEVRGPFMAVLLTVSCLAHARPRWLLQALGAPASKAVRFSSAAAAFALSLTAWWGGPSASSPWITALVLLVAARTLGWRWLIAGAVAVAGIASWALAPGLRSSETLVWVAVLSAGASAALRYRPLQTSAHALTRFFGPPLKDWAPPLWLGAAACLAVAMAAHPASGAALLVAGAALLLVTPDRIESVLATTLLGGAVALWVPPGWIPVGVGAVGLAACALGLAAQERFAVGRVLRWTGAAVSVSSLFLVRELAHTATPIAFALAAGAACLVAWRDRRIAAAPWAMSLLAAHVALAHAGLVLATGKPAAALLPVVSLASALWAAAALQRRAGRTERVAGLSFGGLALAELVWGAALLGSDPSAALVSGAAALILAVACGRRALRHSDEGAAAMALLSLIAGYVAVRLQGFGAPGLGAWDSVAAVAAGAALGVVRAGVFRRTARAGAFGLPLLGLLAAPWASSTLMAALLVGCAAHFAAMAVWRSERRAASLLCAACFNAALLFLWSGTRLGDPVYYVLPAGVSVLVLVWVFRRELSPSLATLLRGSAVTAIYVSSAWRALSFEHLWPLVPCVAICLAGVASGVVLRIRSYVFLGTGVLVTSVLANVVHLGLQDHRLGALFLSAFGLAVVAFMVVFTSNRGELFRRYELLRAALAGWEV